jgi:hypothetical protein
MRNKRASGSFSTVTEGVNLISKEMHIFQKMDSSLMLNIVYLKATGLFP